MICNVLIANVIYLSDRYINKPEVGKSYKSLLENLIYCV